jgi:hypothetical protein
VTFAETLKLLRKRFPCALPVRVRRVKSIKGAHGVTYRKYGEKAVFIINVCIGCSVCEVDTLIHEWAHARTWSLRHDHEEQAEFHDAAWGAEFARLYCAVWNTK